MARPRGIKTDFWVEFQVSHDGLETRDNPAPEASRAFTCFSALPPELRLKIWECLIQARIVVATCFGSRGKDEKRAALPPRPKRPLVPVLLLVNYESRTVALRHYERSFARRHPWAGTGVWRPSSGPGVWFNVDLDVLLLVGDDEAEDAFGFDPSLIYFFLGQDTTRVRHVACTLQEQSMSLYQPDVIFFSLLTAVNIFPAAKRLLITIAAREAEARRLVLPDANNAIQKLWVDFTTGATTVTSMVADKQMLMIREDDLAAFVTEHG